MTSFLHVLAIAAVSWSAPQSPGESPAGASSPVKLPPGYTIGTDDRLSISFWRDKDMSAEVVVRPDGRISLPLLNDVQAAGLTPDQLREQLTQAAAQLFVDAPPATVIVKEIHSRRVFITGNVEKPGMYALNGRMTVMQLIASAGGLREFVGGRNIVILRREGTQDVRLAFDYQSVVKGRNLPQNIDLRPGDTVIVP